jgi:hypothetical protein
MNPLAIGGIVEAVGGVIDDVWTSDEERQKLALQEREIVSREAIAVQEVNKTEAAHPSIFVAGWRPAIGWIGAAAIGYQFLLLPLIQWALAVATAQGMIDPVTPPPGINTDDLWVLLTGMLGIAGMRSLDKRAGADTKQIK